MQQYLESIKLSLETKNYFGAIAMALTLPDICASVEYEGEGQNSVKYSKWFNKYLADTFTQIFHDQDLSVVIFGAQECYAARCSFLHQGTHVIKGQRSLNYAYTPTVSSVNFTSIDKGKYQRNGDILFLDVNFFCEAVINAVDNWMKEIRDDNVKKTKIAAMPIIHESFDSLCGVSK